MSDEPSCSEHGPGDHITGQAFGQPNEFYCDRCDDTFLWRRAAAGPRAGDDIAPDDELRDALVIRGLRKHRATMEAELDRLRARNSEAWDEVARLRSEVAALARDVPAGPSAAVSDRAGTAPTGEARTELVRLLDREFALGGAVVSAAKQVRIVNGALVGIDALNDAVEAWEEQRTAPTGEPPAGLPATLASVDDVAAVCLARGMRKAGPWGWSGDGTHVSVHFDGGETWRGVVVDHDSRVWPVAEIGTGVPSSLLVAAIQAAQAPAQPDQQDGDDR